MSPALPRALSTRKTTAKNIRNKNPTVPFLNLPLKILGKRSLRKKINIITWVKSKTIDLGEKIFSPDSKKYPKRPNGKALKNETEKKSSNRPNRSLFRFDKTNKNKAPPATPPTKESPG
jgi:hypothetical protein